MDFDHYIKDGKKFDRITTILDYFTTPSLLAWKMRVGKKEAGRISREALRIGTNVDEAIRAQVNGEKLPKLKTVEAENCYRAFEQWRADYNVATLITCGTMFNDELMVAGTPDLLWHDTFTLIDVKCSSRISPQYWLQTEFYARSSHGSRSKAILRLDKNLGIYEFQSMSLNENHWAATVGAIKLYRHYKSVDKDGAESEQHECNDSNSASSGTSVGIANDAK